jgi:acetyl esterase/lipase
VCALANPITYVAGGLGLRLLRNIAYREVDSRRLLLDICVPRRRLPAPVLVYIHGGSWTSGGKEQGRALIAAYARRGYLGVSIQYRLAGVQPWPAQIEDCRAAVEWLREHIAEYGGDPERIALVGASAGAQLALCLACGWGVEGVDGTVERSSLPPGTVKGVVSWFGPVDLVPMSTKAHPLEDVLIYLGRDYDVRERNARLASPLLYVSPDDPPALFIHGTADLMVPCWHSQKMHAALKEAGVATELITVEGGKHGFELASTLRMIALNERMLDWLDKTL